MQKNIVTGVTIAMGAESTQKSQGAPISEPLNIDVTGLQADIAYLKDENSKFVTAMEEIQAQNEELRNKIDKLLTSQQPIITKAPKKKSSRKK
tara:strand:+ start:307 stop:585 length:279 start_codon:yes stop_codon:yes gene_type:complete